MSKPPDDYAFIKRVLIMALAIIFTFLLVRFIFVPKDFGRYGHYRGNSIDEIRDQPLKHAGSDSCALCHEDRHILWAGSKHRSVNCEDCHGPLNAHTEDPENFKPKIPQGRDFCILCHGRRISRPTVFPQIDEQEHHPGMACTECHNPHHPWPPAIK